MPEGQQHRAPPEDLAIRVARVAAEDAAALLDLQKRAYESEARRYDDWSLPPLTQTLESLREELATSVALEAVDTGQLVGSVRALERDGTVHIGRLVVAPERQNRGIGTLLMREIESAFPDASRFELFTGSRSEDNLRLYQRLGYRPFREQVVSARLTLVYLEKQR